MTLIASIKAANIYRLIQSITLPMVIMIAVLILVNLHYGVLLFHSLAELFCVIIGITMSVVAWNTHQHTRNYFLLYLGIGYFWIALLDLFHTLTYKGMPFALISSTNISVHFWVYTRGLEALLILSAPLFFTRKFNYVIVFLIGFSAFFLLSYLAIYQEAPLFYIENQGLTRAKVWSEYVIIFLLVIAIFFYRKAQDTINPKVRLYLIISIILTIFAELFFTQYINVYDLANQTGHIFKIASFLVMYFAIVQTMLNAPFSVLTLTAQSYDAIPQPALVIDNSGMIRQANLSAKSTYNITDKDKKHFHYVSHDPIIDETQCEICQHLKARKAMPAKVFENLHNENSYLISLTPIQFHNYQAGFIQIMLDITKQVQEQRNLRLAGTIFNNLSEGILVTDINSKIISINKAFTQITGYTEQEALNNSPKILSSGRHDKSFYDAMWQQLYTTGQWQGEIWNRKKSGEEYPELLSIKALKGKSPSDTHYIAVFSDITKLKDVESKLRHQAHHDSLTGLPNRLLFKNHLDAAIKHTQRIGKKIALLFLDLDNFKSINDSLGHAIGDKVLINVSERLKSVLRENDVVGRYGGDEFLVLIEDFSSNEDLSYISEKLIASLVSPIHHHDDIPIFTSVSIGICVFPDDSASLEELIQFADAAMYKSKSKGKNSFIFHSARDNEKAKRRLLLESKLREAIDRNEISVVYQPKINVDTYKIIGAEALVRWKNSELGDVYPDEFIPLAESIGEIHRLGEFVLYQALAEVKKWRKLTNSHLTVAVNFSSKQFIRNNLDEIIEQALISNQLPNDSLEIEITESLLLEKSPITINLIQSIARLGVSIAIDDFGTGYSALSYLKHYPIDVIKIDKSFIDGVTVNNEDAILVKTIILMAHGLGMSVVAEGVEDKNQFSFIQNEQGDSVQGYYFSKPLSKDDFIATLKNWDTQKFTA